MNALENQVAIITGAGSGIGAATAIRFADEDGAVVLVGRTREQLDRVAQRIGRPDRVAIVPGDVTQPSTAEGAVRAADERWSRLDVLVSNAATFNPVAFPDKSANEWREMLDTILMGAFRFAREACRLMIAKKIPGRIVNVTSIHGTQAEAAASSYGAAKAAVNQFTRCLAVELAQYGIRANAVAPGFVDTPMSVVDGVNELDTPRFQELYVKHRRIPMARAARPEEIASVILFLASEASSYVNGHVLVVDGGLTCTF
ncbi:MAG: SDR family oxidoreductase [Verrucomicrobia bacterium]|nr:SDR family oxidoreductase [Verrucomicrobiota bacterium]